MTRVALDSNILAYFAGVEHAEADRDKIASIQHLIESLLRTTILVTPVQALGELFTVMRRAGAPAAVAREALLTFTDGFETVASEQRTAIAAADLAVNHKLQFWDAMILSAAADAGCAMLLSEDMQHGFVVRGLTIVNPFAEPMHPKLAALLESAAG